MMPTTPPATVDEYLASVSSESARRSLIALREVIREAAPDAEEIISYGIPTYKCAGYVASFAAFKKHCSFFPGHTVADFSEDLKGYRISKGTIQFAHDNPLPSQLVQAMVKARIAENLARVSGQRSET